MHRLSCGHTLVWPMAKQKDAKLFWKADQLTILCKKVYLYVAGNQVQTLDRSSWSKAQMIGNGCALSKKLLFQIAHMTKAQGPKVGNLFPFLLVLFYLKMALEPKVRSRGRRRLSLLPNDSYKREQMGLTLYTGALHCGLHSGLHYSSLCCPSSQVEGKLFNFIEVSK